jgi:hypothetical protein
MLILDSLRFVQKDPYDFDERLVVKFNFVARGIKFYSWKIRRKENGGLVISPPFLKHNAERTAIIEIVDKEEFIELAKTVISAAFETGVIK